jgi:DNA-binding PadR family transcriptional regulator
MRRPTYYILAALLDGPRHGYAIAQRAAVLSERRVTIPAGTLYGALDRLVELGQVVVAREDVVDGRLRRYYEITDDGRRALGIELQDMRAAVDVVADMGGLEGLSPA